MSDRRYANDWNEYSKMWDRQFGRQYQHLGDEWNDDQTADRRRDAYYFAVYAERFLHPEFTALEIGPGGGKWTVRIAPRVKRLIVLDVAEAMLERTRARCEAAGIHNVEYIHANGQDFRPLPDDSVHFFFSHDVFVHIAIEDTFPYAQEIARVLAPGGYGACHHAINSPPEAWKRIEQHNDWYRGGRHTLGQYYYFSPDALRRMYEHCGLSVIEQHTEVWNCVSVFQKPPASLVPRLEALLRQLAGSGANGAAQRQAVVAALRALPEQLQASLAPVLDQAAEEPGEAQRVELAQTIRHIWRNL